MTPEECDAVIAAGRSNCGACAAALYPRHRSVVNTETGVASKVIRRSSSVFIDDSHDLVRRFSELVQSVNQRLYHFDLAGSEQLQYAEYGPGDGYGDHLDIGPGSAGLRKLSASVQLTDPSTYDGGDLVIWGSGAVPRERGGLIVFPSYLVHRVETVTRGTRASLVVWATGTQSFK